MAIYLRSFVVAGGLLVAGWAAAQEAPTKLEFKCPADRASKVLAALSKASGASLTASTHVANDVLLVNFKDAALDDAMAKIAQAIGGEWRKEGSGWVLYRGANLEAAEGRQETALRVAAFRKNIQERSKSLEGRESSPSAKTVTLLLSKMSDAQLGQMVSRQRTVFALNPNRMQVPFPTGSQPILHRFCQEQISFVEKLKKDPKYDPGSDSTVGDGDLRAGIGYAILVAYYDKSWDFVVFYLSIFDSQGRLLGSDRDTLGLDLAFKKPPTEFAEGASEERLQLSPLARESAQALKDQRTAIDKMGFGGSVSVADSDISVPIWDRSSAPKLSAELKERVLNPEKYEPLALAPSEALLESSRQLGRNLVAYLPDTALHSVSPLAIEAKATPSVFLNAIQTKAALNVKSAGDWIVVSPRFPQSDRGRSADRVALGKALRTLQSNGDLSLDELSSYAALRSEAPERTDLDTAYFAFVSVAYVANNIDKRDMGGTWRTLQLYDSFSAAQRSIVAESGNLPFTRMTAQQMASLGEQVFNSAAGIFVDWGDSPARVPDERTIVLPNGLTREGVLHVTNQTTEGVIGKSLETEGAMFLSPSGVAFAQLLADPSYPLQVFGAHLPTLFRPASRRTINMKFTLSAQTSFSCRLLDTTTKQKHDVAFEMLPERIRKEVNEVRERLSREVGRDGGRTPPPR